MIKLKCRTINSTYYLFLSIIIIILCCINYKRGNEKIRTQLLKNVTVFNKINQRNTLILKLDTVVKINKYNGSVGSSNGLFSV